MFTVVMFPTPQLIKLCNNQVQVKRHISRLPKESVNDLWLANWIIILCNNSSYKIFSLKLAEKWKPIIHKWCTNITQGHIITQSQNNDFFKFFLHFYYFLIINRTFADCRGCKSIEINHKEGNSSRIPPKGIIAINKWSV